MKREREREREAGASGKQIDREIERPAGRVGRGRQWNMESSEPGRLRESERERERGTLSQHCTPAVASFLQPRRAQEWNKRIEQRKGANETETRNRAENG